MLEISTGGYVIFSLLSIISPHITSRFFKGSFIYDVMFRFIIYPLFIFIHWGVFEYGIEFKILLISGSRETNEIMSMLFFIIMVLSYVIANYVNDGKVKRERW